MKPGFGYLHLSDFWKALLISAIYLLLVSMAPIFSQHRLPTASELAGMGYDVINLMIAYFIKNLVTNNEGQLFKKDK